MRDIGKNIRDLREHSGLTQEELAQKLFVTRQTVSNYETGKSRPDVDMVLRIAQTLNVDANTVFYGIPVPESRKAARRRVIIISVILLFIALLSILLHRLFKILLSNYFLSAPAYTLEVLYDPAAWLLLGWWLTELILFCLRAKQLPRNPKAVRILQGILLACLALQLPMLVFEWTAFYRVLTSDSVSMHFPHIPVYSDLLYLLQLLCYKFSAVFTVPGALLRLFDPPTK